MHEPSRDPQKDEPVPPGAGGDGHPAVDQLESEWQFDAPDPRVLRKWLLDNADSATLRISPLKPRRIHDLYLDTPDLRIFRAGYALRIRRSGASAEASLKELAPRRSGVAIRREITQPMRSPQRGDLFDGAGPVTERLRLLCREDELVPIAPIRTERQVFLVTLSPESDEPAAAGPDEPPVPGSNGSQRPSAEVALDRTFLTDTLGRTHRLARLEIEVPYAELAIFRPLAERLRRDCDLREARQSKFEWALAANRVRVDKTMSLGSVPVEPSMTVGRVADAVIRKHLAAFLWNEPGTRLGDDPERLHDMRVACRRLRAAFKLFRDAYPEGVADGLRLRLDDVGRRLGEVRDLDVFADHLRIHCAGLLVAGAGSCALLVAHFREEREQSRGRMMEMLDSLRFLELKRDLLDLARAGPPAGGDETEASILRFGPQKVRRAWRRLERQGNALKPDSPAAEYHRLRILGKRLRYAIEFHADLYAPASKELIAVLVELQDLLGLHQDSQVSISKLRAVAAERPSGFAPETWAALGELAEIFRSQAADLRREFPRIFRRTQGKRWRALRRRMKKVARRERGSSKAAGNHQPAGDSGPVDGTGLVEGTGPVEGPGTVERPGAIERSGTTEGSGTAADSEWIDKPGPARRPSTDTLPKAAS